MTEEKIAQVIREEAVRVGFDAVGFTTADPPDSIQVYLEWIARGYHGEMAYMARTAPQRVDPRSLLPSARSVIVVGLNYAPARGSLPARAGAARVSCYAWGEDYHAIMRSRMRQLARRIRDRTELSFATRICVDTPPLLERALAQRAGLGWIGKNSNLINQRFGAWLFLGAMLVDLDLPPDKPGRDRCGTCTRCLEACPTGAILEPRLLDARRCISYLTIELKGSIPVHLRPAIGGRLYGCDDCLVVCPWNRFAPASPEPGFAPPRDNSIFDPARILSLSENQFRRQFKSSPIFSIGRCRLARNAAVVLGNRIDLDADPLYKALFQPDCIVRRHVAWALGCRGDEAARRALDMALENEKDDPVRAEIENALRAVSAENAN